MWNGRLERHWWQEPLAACQQAVEFPEPGLQVVQALEQHEARADGRAPDDTPRG